MPDRVSQRLVGTWRHSHEEDTATEAVYRPDSYAFPPSRGRMGFTFRLDGSCTAIGISPRDGPAPEECHWRVRGGRKPEVVVTWSGGRQQVLSIVSIDRDRLVVRKQDH